MAGAGDLETEQARLLGPNQEATRPSCPPAPQGAAESREHDSNSRPDRPNRA
jgi:hypothetical protein